MPIDPRDLEARVIEAVPDPLAQIRPIDIGPLFGRAPTWFHRNHKMLEAAGFPRPVTRGVYLRRDVVRFMMARAHGLPVDQPRPSTAGLPARGPGAYELYLAHVERNHRSPRRRVQ